VCTCRYAPPHAANDFAQLDQHYEEHRKISAGDGLRGDLHSFFITEQQTAVFTSYQVVQADLSGMGKDTDSYIWESLFQELDIDTGDVVFEWRASHHFPFEDSYTNPNVATHNAPWDFFHINMIDKDDKGNYLVSSRYARAVMYISKDTGEILWTLGGKGNSFKDLSDGDATTFVGQHDAHFAGDDFSDITMFDNRADWFNKIEDESIGHRIHLDLTHMTAEIVQSYRHPQHWLSTSQGSMQTLPNGNVLLGYGFNGVLTEYSPNGEMLCDAYFSTPRRFGSGDVQSYRNLKFNWTGVPLTTPSLHFEGQKLYMSWLGSTKLRSWTLQDSDTADGAFKPVHRIVKNGFETGYVLTEGHRLQRYVRVVATGEKGVQLSISNPVDLVDPTEIWGQPQPGEETHHPLWDFADETSEEETPSYPISAIDDMGDVQFLLVLGALFMISAALVAWLFFYGGCRMLRRPILSEKPWSTGRFSDDGRWRRLVHLVKLKIADLRQSWRYGPLASQEDDREGHAGEPILSNVELRTSMSE